MSGSTLPAGMLPPESGRVYVGWTGTRHGSPEVERAIHRAFDRIDADAQIVTGACVGVDALVARYATSLGMAVHAVVPSDRSRVDPEWLRYCTTYEEMAPGTTYRDRNERIVALTTSDLFAVPEHPEGDPRSRRSGTWQTVRMARRARKRVHVHVMVAGAVVR
jgi:hypothetical protein